MKLFTGPIYTVWSTDARTINDLLRVAAWYRKGRGPNLLISTYFPNH